MSSLFDEAVSDEKKQPSLFDQAMQPAAPTAQPSTPPMSVWDAINTLSQKNAQFSKNTLLGIGRGGRDLIDSGAWLLTKGMEAAAPKGSATEAFFKKERQKVEKINKDALQQYQQAVVPQTTSGLITGKQPDIPVESQFGRLLGNIATSFVPGTGQARGAELVNNLWNSGGALKKLGAIGLSGLLGAEQSVLTGQKTGEENIADQAKLGAIAGTASKPVAAVAGRILNPNLNPDVRTLLNEGVRLTPGQIMGGGTQRIEQASTSIPGLGDLIANRSREAVVNDTTKMALNRVLRPIGQKIPTDLPENVNPVAWAGDKVSEVYGDITSKANLGLTKPLKKSFDAIANKNPFIKDIYDKEILSRFGKIEQPKGETWNYVTKQENIPYTPIMRGNQIKNIDQQLGNLYRQQISYYKANQDPKILANANAIRDLHSIFRKGLAVQNPSIANELKQANEAWSKLVVIEDAASRPGAPTGYLSPSALNSAIKSQAKRISIRGRSYARGEAQMQDLSDAALNVMGSKVPDSGTPIRAMTAFSLGNLPKLAAAPAVWGMGGLGSLLYSRPGMAAARNILANRPELMQQIGQGMPQIPATLLNALGINLLENQ